MKKLIIASLIIVSSVSFAQVAIGKTTVSSPSSSLEFGNSGVGADLTDASKQKGLVLPWVSTVADQPVTGYEAMSTTENGTLIFDLSDDKIKLKVPVSRSASGWLDLTVKNRSEVIDGIANIPVDSEIQDTKTELADAKAVIGAAGSTDTTPGILVLSDTDKAMVLPLVESYASVIAPSAGMMVYDLTNEMLCVYNGTVWTFWKP